MRSFLKTSSCLCALLLLFVTTSYSQQTRPLRGDNSPTVTLFLVPHFNPMFGLGYVNPNKTLLEVAEGSQYFDEEFKEIKNTSKEGKVKARYNAFFDEMEVEKEGELGLISKFHNREKIVFTDNGTAFKILDAKANPEISALGYYQVLLENNYVSLYKKNAKKLSVGVNLGVYMTPPPEIVTEFQELKTAYFIELNNSGIAQRVPRTRGGLAKIFKDKKDVIKKYIKENKLKVTRDEDMIQIFTFINTLK